MQYFVHPNKISNYPLSLASVRGASKARFFLVRGFSINRPDELEAATLCHALEATLAKRTQHPEGHLLVFECEAQAPDGSRPCMRSVRLEQDDALCRFVTAHPMKSNA